MPPCLGFRGGNEKGRWSEAPTPLRAYNVTVDQDQPPQYGWFGYAFLSLMVGFLCGAAFLFGPPVVFGLLGIRSGW